MTADDILELMKTAALPEAHVANEEIAGLLALRVAELSGKLSSEDLYGLIAIGALMYQPEQPGQDAIELGTEDLLIKTLKVGGNA